MLLAAADRDFSSQPSSSAPNRFRLRRTALEPAIAARARDIAMYTYEAVAVLLLEPRERFFDEIFALAVRTVTYFSSPEVNHVV